MLEKFVKNYVGKLTIDDVDLYAKDNGIFFDYDELNFVFLLIKEKWPIILKKDIDQVLIEIKDNVSDENYEKIKNLLYVFKEKYKHYL